MEADFRLVLADRCLLHHVLRDRSQSNLDHRVFQKQVKLFSILHSILPTNHGLEQDYHVQHPNIQPPPFSLSFFPIKPLVSAYENIQFHKLYSTGRNQETFLSSI